MNGDLSAAIERSRERPEATARLFEASGDFGFELRLGGEGAAKIFEGGLGLILLLLFFLFILRGGDDVLEGRHEG